MKFAPVTLLPTPGNMSASFNSIGIDLNQTPLYSIQAVWTGAPVGTFKLQISNDFVGVASVAGNPVGTDPAANVVNWTDYTGSSTVVSGAGNFVWNVLDAGYRWVRLAYVAGSGSGSAKAEFCGKGV